MEFCTHCGLPTDENRAFCIHCGESYPVKDKVVEFETPKESPAPSVKVKVAIISVLLIGGLLMGAHVFLANKFSPASHIEQVTRAIQDGDGEALSEFVSVSNKKVTIDKEILKDFSMYISENNNLIELGKQLNAGWEETERTNLAFKIQDEKGNDIFTIESGEKKWGIYEQAKIKIVPFQQSFTSNISEGDAEVEVEDEKLTLTSGEENPILIIPRKLSGTATFQGEYGSQTVTYETDPSSGMDNKIVSDIHFQVSEVRIVTNYEEATLYMNGKSTGKSIEQLNSTLNEVPQDASISFHAVYKGSDGKDFISNVIAFNGEEEITLEFEEEKEDDPRARQDFPVSSQTEVASGETEAGSTTTSLTAVQVEGELFYTLENYLYAAVEAINTGDFSSVQHYTFSDSPAYLELVDYTQYLQGKNITESLVRVHLIGIEMLDEKNYEVTVDTSYEIYYNDGTTKIKDFRETFHLNRTSKQFSVYQLMETVEQ
ncbi:TcaA NTF2-like domain-containing protein [Rossellomorea arthrocnemi]